MTEFTISKKMTIFVFVAIAFLLIAAAICFLFFDQQALRYLYKLNMHWNYSKVAVVFKYLGKAWLLVWLILFWGILTGRNRAMIITLLALLAVAPTVLPLKLLTHRQRPRDYIESVIKKNQNNLPEPTSGRSFPSGDTASAFAVAVALLPFVRSLWLFVLLPAGCLIGLFRVLDFAHYPSDAFAGAAAGIFAGWLILKIFSHLPLPNWADSKYLSAAKIAAFILIPLFLAIKDFTLFTDVMVFYGTALVPVLAAFIILKNYPKT